ncbi:hypothetical protein ACGIF2_07690 [Cellulomonas sp. P22]
MVRDFPSSLSRWLHSRPQRTESEATVRRSAGDESAEAACPQYWIH